MSTLTRMRLDDLHIVSFVCVVLRRRFFCWLKLGLNWNSQSTNTLLPILGKIFFLFLTTFSFFLTKFVTQRSVLLLSTLYVGKKHTCNCCLKLLELCWYIVKYKFFIVPHLWGHFGQFGQDLCHVDHFAKMIYKYIFKFLENCFV